MLPVVFVEQIRLGLEEARFGERQFDLPAFCCWVHRHVTPGGAGGHGANGMGGDDFAAAGGGAADVGAETGGPIFGCGRPAGGLHGKKNFIPDKTQAVFAGRRGHGWIGRLHAEIFTMKRPAEKSKSVLLWVCWAAWGFQVGNEAADFCRWKTSNYGDRDIKSGRRYSIAADD